jgi:hypothetical protein
VPINGLTYDVRVFSSASLVLLLVVLGLLVQLTIKNKKALNKSSFFMSVFKERKDTINKKDVYV